MMGVGQVVTLRFPVSQLREVNLAMEQCSWGAFETELSHCMIFSPFGRT